jgi:hypothetical protein
MVAKKQRTHELSSFDFPSSAGHTFNFTLPRKALYTPEPPGSQEDFRQAELRRLSSDHFKTQAAL